MLSSLFIFERREVVTAGLKLFPRRLVVVSVGQEKSTVAFAGKLLNHVLVDDPIALLWCHFHDITPLANEADAFLNDNLWSSFDKHSHLSSLAWMPDYSGGSLALRVEG